jgi:hypothetical protein
MKIIIKLTTINKLIIKIEWFLENLLIFLLRKSSFNS